MSHHKCLNCEATIHGKFCANCGQKADTHRITLKHFVLHDLLHGIWHLERGILFTLKETFKRPGQAALDYISGKRIRYYNVFYLCLLVIGLNLLLVHYYNSMISEQYEFKDETPQVTDFFKAHLKFILLSIVPILAINAGLVFRRLKLNLAEHFILSGISLLGILIISMFFSFFDFINFLDFTSRWEIFSVFAFLEVFAFFVMFLFPIWSYYDATRNDYTFWQFVWRIAMFYVLVLLQLALILSIIILILTHGKGNFSINV